MYLARFFAVAAAAADKSARCSTFQLLNVRHRTDWFFFSLPVFSESTASLLSIGDAAVAGLRRPARGVNL